MSREDPSLDPPVMTSLTVEAPSVVIDHSSALCPGHVVVIFLLMVQLITKERQAFIQIFNFLHDFNPQV